MEKNKTELESQFKVKTDEIFKINIIQRTDGIPNACITLNPPKGIRNVRKLVKNIMYKHNALEIFEIID